MRESSSSFTSTGRRRSWNLRELAQHEPGGKRAGERPRSHQPDPPGRDSRIERDVAQPHGGEGPEVGLDLDVDLESRIRDAHLGPAALEQEPENTRATVAAWNAGEAEASHHAP